MAQLNDTLVNGDLRVNGNIYGIITSAQSAASAEKLTNTAIKVASATSATSANELINKAIKVNSAGSAATSVSGYWSKADDNTDLDRVIGVALAGASGSWTAGNAFYGSTTYDSAFTYNSKSNTLKVPNISATNISGNLTGVATSATSAKAADGLKSTAYKVASATSATNADKLTNARNIAASGGVTWSVSFNGTAGVTGNAVVNSVPWSAISSHAAAVDSSTTNKFTTPKAVNDAITASMSTKASFKGPYTARSAIPAADLDKLSIYLVGPSGSGVDKYEEWILTGTTTAQMLQIGDTSTDLSNYAKTNGSYTALSAGYSTATNTAQTMKSAQSAATATKVQMQAKSDNTWYQSLFASTSTSSIWYDSDAKVQYNPSSNIFSATNLYGTTVSGATISGTNITAATTVRGTNISGTNISGASKTATIDNLITSASRAIPIVNNKTITITTGASPATASFSTNTADNKTITLGSMALKASGDYSLTSHNHSYTLSGNGTAVNVSAGVNFKPSGSNIKFYVSGNDIYISANDTTGTDTKVTQSSSTENSALPFILKRTTTGNETNTVKYSTAATYNPSTREFKIVASNGEDSVSITPTHLSCTYGEISQPCSVNLSNLIEVTSYFSSNSAKSACSATSAKNAGTASYALTVPDSAVTGKTIGTANNAKQVSSTHTANNANFYLEFIDSTANGYKKLYHNTGLQYNPSAHILYISGSSATIVNGDDNTVTVDKQRFNFINGITNTVSTATNTRITSGVGIFGSNNTAMGLKNGAIIGTNIKVTGNNTAGYNISNILFLGDNNVVDNLSQYENAKLIISQGKTWGGTLHGTDVFAIKGGGSVWSNVLKRNTEDVFDCNGHNDTIYNYAPMYKMPVASPTQDQTYHYNSTYGVNDNYLVVSRDGFLVPTDITISKTTDTLLGKDAAARMVLINLVAGKETQGTITVGQDAPGYLNVGTYSTGTVRLGDNYADVKIGYANSGSYGTVDIGNNGNNYSNLRVYGNETVSAITALTAYIPILTSVNFTSTNISGTTFYGGTFSGNLSGSAASALSAGTAVNVKWTRGTDDTYRPIAFADAGKASDYNAGNNFYASIVYDSAGLSYNPANNRLSAEKLYTNYIHIAENCTEYVTASDVTQIQNPRICFSACENNDHQQGYLIWSDFNNTNLWTTSDTAWCEGQPSDGFVLTSNQGNSIFAAKNISAKNIRATNITGYLNGTAKYSNYGNRFARKRWWNNDAITKPYFLLASALNTYSGNTTLGGYFRLEHGQAHFFDFILNFTTTQGKNIDSCSYHVIQSMGRFRDVSAISSDFIPTYTYNTATNEKIIRLYCHNEEKWRAYTLRLLDYQGGYGGGSDHNSSWDYNGDYWVMNKSNSVNDSDCTATFVGTRISMSLSNRYVHSESVQRIQIGGTVGTDPYTLYCT